MVMGTEARMRVTETVALSLRCRRTPRDLIKRLKLRRVFQARNFDNFSLLYQAGHQRK